MLLLAAFLAVQQQKPLTNEGSHGAGKGKTIVLLAGDEEYRSEEGLPQLAKILAVRHGFKCIVLFSLNRKGEIDPNEQANEPGIEALDKADLCVMQLRFRHWPDDQMKHFVDYYKSGRPILALRTSTHAFDYPPDSASSYKDFGWRSTTWPGGFGKQGLGETWVSHWGEHGKEATLGLPEPNSKHPILIGVDQLFGTTDVYEAHPPADAQILFRGLVLTSFDPKAPPAHRSKKTSQGTDQDINNPAMPIVWTRGHTVTTTLGAGSRVTSYLGKNLAAAGTPPAFQDFDAFPGFTGGVFVG